MDLQPVVRRLNETKRIPADPTPLKFSRPWTSLQIEWLQEIDEFEAAAATAQQMDEQAKRTANEKLMQDGLIATEAEKTGGDGRICATSLVPGAEDESIDLDKTYEAAVWAKVMHASLTIRKTELFKHGIMGTGSELLLIEGMSTHMNINTSTHIAGGGISSSWKVGYFKDF